MAGQLAKKEYRNAHKILVGAFCYVLIVGGLASMACFLFADSIVGKSSAMVLKVFTPTIFFSGLLGVFRGREKPKKSAIKITSKERTQRPRKSCFFCEGQKTIQQTMMRQSHSVISDS